MDIRPQGPDAYPLPRDAAPAAAAPVPTPPAAPADALWLSATVPARPAEAPASDDRRGWFKELVEKASDAAGDLVVLAGHVPLLGKLGYWAYGALTKPAPDAPLANQGTLSATVMRGAQPSDAGYAALRAQGVDTVVNLRPEAPWADAMAARAGLAVVSLPLPAIGAPTTAQALAFLKAVTDPANGRVYFNCQRGIDRTGAMAAAYRIAAQGWSLDRAAAEMRQFGFKEGVESDKLEFLRRFDAAWRATPPPVQAEILHRSVEG
jgi:protein tyrosine phosphatase (PTP) superfamily phosphohydrolase (DUF442 family)